MNPALAQLRPYPFERLRALLAGARPPADLKHISLSIGEPRHSATAVRAGCVDCKSRGISAATRRLPAYFAAAQPPQPRGSRGVFKLPQGCCRSRNDVDSGERHARRTVRVRAGDGGSGAAHPLVVMPNPFYQIYEGAAFLAGAQPYFLGNDRANAYLPDLDDVPPEVWQRCQLLFLCSPSNPTGAVASIDYLRRAIALAERYDFVIASDECYSEIYLDEAHPPPGLLQAAVASGHNGFERCVVFHSLSKRSSVPGLRSGFRRRRQRSLIQSFLQYRTYHGCALPLPTQFASIAAWNDDEHVLENRRLYREKFAKVLPVLREVLEVDAPASELLPVAESARRRTLRAAAVRASARHRATGQLHRARYAERQSGPRPRTYLAGGHRD